MQLLPESDGQVVQGMGAGGNVANESPDEVSDPGAFYWGSCEEGEGFMAMNWLAVGGVDCLEEGEKGDVSCLFEGRWLLRP